MKKTLIMLLSLLSMQALALNFIYTNTKFWGGEGNKYAIEGYDTVAYFQENKAIKGDKKFKLEYQKAEWHFSNQQNLELFKKDPQKYAPQYGGHCAWRMAIDGVGVYGNPKLWTIVDKKLYLNYNKEVNTRWNKNIPGFIKDADSFWFGKNKFKTLN